MVRQRCISTIFYLCIALPIVPLDGFCQSVFRGYELIDSVFFSRLETAAIGEAWFDVTKWPYARLHCYGIRDGHYTEIEYCQINSLKCIDTTKSPILGVCEYRGVQIALTGTVVEDWFRPLHQLYPAYPNTNVGNNKQYGYQISFLWPGIYARCLPLHLDEEYSALEARMYPISRKNVRGKSLDVSFGKFSDSFGLIERMSQLIEGCKYPMTESGIYSIEISKGPNGLSGWFFVVRPLLYGIKELTREGLSYDWYPLSKYYGAIRSDKRIFLLCGLKSDFFKSEERSTHIKIPIIESDGLSDYFLKGNKQIYVFRYEKELIFFAYGEVDE